MWNASRGASPDLRFAELYAKALDRLGDPRTTQRVGALRTLEVLGQDNPLHRQAVIDVLCAELRAPAGDDTATWMGVQRMLAHHLQPGAGPAFWPGLAVDLTGATLVDFDLSGCHLAGLTLDGALCQGQTKLRGLVVRGPVSAQGATFEGHAWLERCVLSSSVQLDGTRWYGDVWFGEATVGGPATLGGAEFAGHAWFGNAVFRSRLVLAEAMFRRSAGFRGASFYGGVDLTGTTFLGPARVSMRDDDWNVSAPGWRVVIDADNASVGRLLWVGHGALFEPSAAGLG